MRRVVFEPKTALSEFMARMARHEAYTEPYTCIGLMDDHEIIASVAYNYYVPNVRVCMHVAALPGRRWATRGYMRACFDYAFNRLGCKVVVGMVPANNTLARRFDEHIGFTCNGEIPHGYGDDDLLIYTMTREECRWI